MQLAIALHSDLHLELQDWPTGFMSGPAPDVIVLAGDIDRLTDVDLHLYELAARFPTSHVIVVLGNHEGYRLYDMPAAEASLKATFADHPRIHILQKDSVIIGGVRFLGCTLWTRFMGGGEALQADSKRLAQRNIQDFRVIGYQGRHFTADDCLALGEAHEAWLATALAMPFEGKTVVVTHFAPSMQLANRKYGRDALTPYFNADLDQLIHAHGPELWLYGHTHDNFDTHIGQTRVVSNQRGYGAECGNSYDPNLLIML